jgi:hypothetical protein
MNTWKLFCIGKFYWTQKPPSLKGLGFKKVDPQVLRINCMIIRYNWRLKNADPQVLRINRMIIRYNGRLEKPDPQVLRINCMIIIYNWVITNWAMFANRSSFELSECLLTHGLFGAGFFYLSLESRVEGRL